MRSLLAGIVILGAALSVMTTVPTVVTMLHAQIKNRFLIGIERGVKSFGAL